MRILALEVATPLILLVLASASGLVAAFTRPLTQRPLSTLVNRLEESPKPIVTVIGTLIGAVLAGLTALANYLKS